MRTLKTAAVLMLAWSFSGPVLAAEEKQIGWDDLAPTDVVYEDPFADLTLDQISDLANLLRLETGLEDGIDDGSDVQDRIDLLRKRLSEQEIDADPEQDAADDSDDADILEFSTEDIEESSDR